MIMNEIKVDAHVLELLDSAKTVLNDVSRQIMIGSIITKVFMDNHLPAPVLVGGMAVAVYTDGRYASMDLDFKSNTGSESHILRNLGFVKIGKDYFNASLNSYVEFPSGNFEDSQEKIRKFEVKETGLPLFLIGIEDLILDRIGSFVATKDLGSEEWAIRLLGAFYAHIDWGYFHKKANSLGMLKQVQRVQGNVKSLRKKYADIQKQAEDETSVASDTSTVNRMRLF